MPAPITQALLSVSDKTGLVDVRPRARAGLASRCCPPAAPRRRWRRRASRSPRSATTPAFPEMLDGRVKTLHPKVHGGILARRDLPAHAPALAAHGIPPIDLVVVNLYPFRETVAKAGLHARGRDREHRHRRPDDAARGGEELAARRRRRRPGRLRRARSPSSRQSAGALSARDALRARAEGVLAHRVLRRRDLELAHRARPGRRGGGVPRALQPAGGRRCRTCATARTRTSRRRSIATRSRRPGAIATYRQLQGKELSYNNIADADAALGVREDARVARDAAACVIVKHANPCGVALAATPLERLPERVRHRSDLGVRRHHRLQPAGRRGDARGRVGAVPRGADRARPTPPTRWRVIAQKKNVRVLEIALPGGRPGAAARPQARRRRLPRAERRCRERRRRRAARRDRRRRRRRRSSPTCCSPGASPST